MKKIFILIGLLVAVVILFISVVMANLETVMREEKEDRLRVIPIEIITEKSNGEKIKSVYYLPKIKIYPTNVLYPLKIWRDKVWLWLTPDPCEKSRLLILIADKQIMEEDQISADEAVDKLIEAWNLCPNDRPQIGNVVKAYRQITAKMRKYLKANEKIEKFIEKEKIVVD